MMLAMVALSPCQALSEPAPSPPDLDCGMGFTALRNWAQWLPGAKRTSVGGRDIVTVGEQDVWRVEIIFTEPGQTAHPAVTLRKFVKQVTGVWTAQSKGCGYGNQMQFGELVAEMKAEDSRLTNASRAEVEQRRKEVSPLGGGP
jgi:hypothetical protein